MAGERRDNNRLTWALTLCVAAPAAAEEAPAKPKRTRKKKVEAVEEAPAEAAPAIEPAPAAEETPAKPKRTRKKAAAPTEESVTAEAAPETAAEAEPAASDEPP
ncbi:MAG TPA: hypothetical protein PKZ99_00915, partial [Azospirillaceae bacterium]|nr:hypothetical protein [Azospirillaceae bacterium]